MRPFWDAACAERQALLPSALTAEYEAFESAHDVLGRLPMCATVRFYRRVDGTSTPLEPVDRAEDDALVNRAIVLRLRVSPAVRQILLRWIGVARLAYNMAIDVSAPASCHRIALLACFICN